MGKHELEAAASPVFAEPGEEDAADGALECGM
jgi:hypothetical protein